MATIAEMYASPILMSLSLICAMNMTTPAPIQSINTRAKATSSTNTKMHTTQLKGGRSHAQLYYY